MRRITKYGQHEVQLIKKAKASVLYVIIISSGYTLPVIIIVEREEERDEGWEKGKGREERRRREKRRGQDGTGEEKIVSSESNGMIPESLLR